MPIWGHMLEILAHFHEDLEKTLRETCCNRSKSLLILVGDEHYTNSFIFGLAGRPCLNFKCLCKLDCASAHPVICIPYFVR